MFHHLNIVPGLHSVYRWQGAVEHAGEVLLLIKTTRARYPALEKAFEGFAATRVGLLQSWAEQVWSLLDGIAAVADKAGNCRFHAAARNFNPPAAMSGRITVVEAERVVEVGELAPDDIHLPGIFIQRIVELTPEQATRKSIEQRTTRTRESGDAQS